MGSATPWAPSLASCKVFRGFGFLAGHLQVFRKALDNTRFVEAGAVAKEPWFWSQRPGFGGAAVMSSVCWSVQWVSKALSPGHVGRLRRGTDRILAGSGLVGPRGSPGWGNPLWGPEVGRPPPCRPVWGGERRRVASLAEPAGGPAALVLLVFSFCLSDASLLNYLPREFGLLHLWFWQGLHTDFCPGGLLAI